MLILKRSFIAIMSILSILIITSFAYLQLNPEFGTLPTEEQMQQYELTGHYEDEKFLNLEPFEIDFSPDNIMAMLNKAMNRPDNMEPKHNIEVEPINIAKHQQAGAAISWLGHSSFFIQLEGKNILIDPMFSQTLGPVHLFSPKRFNKKMPVSIEDLPNIDVIIVSHDHYDHLDYDSIKKLIAKTDKFLVPLGVGNHLCGWGVAESRIIELDWWQSTTLDGQTYVLTPSQHMSGRRLTDQSATLWGSWVIQGKDHNLYFSGDGGYGSHFAEIGERYGPFDVALMECGQYDELWSHVHLMPEQTVQAGMEVKAKLIMPIHWGSFILANHTWADPVIRATAEAQKQGIPMTTPKIGETLVLNAMTYPVSKWWQRYL